MNSSISCSSEKYDTMTLSTKSNPRIFFAKSILFLSWSVIHWIPRGRLRTQIPFLPQRVKVFSPDNISVHSIKAFSHCLSLTIAVIFPSSKITLSPDCMTETISGKHTFSFPGVQKRSSASAGAWDTSKISQRETVISPCGHISWMRGFGH